MKDWRNRASIKCQGIELSLFASRLGCSLRLLSSHLPKGHFIPLSSPQSCCKPPPPPAPSPVSDDDLALSFTKKTGIIRLLTPPSLLFHSCLPHSSAPFFSSFPPSTGGQAQLRAKGKAPAAWICLLSPRLASILTPPLLLQYPCQHATCTSVFLA